MKKYIKSSEELRSIVEIHLYDGSKRSDVAFPNTFSMTAFDDEGFEIEIGVNCDNPSEYYLESTLGGTLYVSRSLYDVLVQFTDMYDVSRDFVRQIFKFARNYVAR
jgi:hypothetical protein